MIQRQLKRGPSDEIAEYFETQKSVFLILS